MVSIGQSIKIMRHLYVNNGKFISAQCSGNIYCTDCTSSLNKAFLSGNILIGGRVNNKTDDLGCQLSCQAITNCAYWTFFYQGGSLGYCELHDGVDSFPVDLADAVSGPKFCP